MASGYCKLVKGRAPTFFLAKKYFFTKGLTRGRLIYMAKVKKGMTAKQIAVLHYDLLMANNKKEWLKTVRKRLRDLTAQGKRGARHDNWWEVGRQRVEEKGVKYKYKNKDERQSTDTSVKFFFHRLLPDGSKLGSGQVPIRVVKDKDDDDEWRVVTSSW